MINNQQLLLDLKFVKLIDWRDFYVTSANADAVQWLQHFLSIDMNILWIYGPNKSGKSHLGKLWADSVQAKEITKKDLALENINPLINEKKFFFIDDAEIIKIDEEWFFHFFNQIIYTKNRKLKVLVLSNYKIADLGLTLKDLISRLLTGSEVEIKDPDDELIEKLIYKALFEYGIRCSGNEIKFISSRIQRNYEDILRFVEKIHMLKTESNGGLLTLVRNLLS